MSSDLKQINTGEKKSTFSFCVAFISRVHGVGFGIGPSKSSPAGRSAACGLGLVAGHGRLRRQLFLRRANQLPLFAESIERPEYICRSSDTESIEHQANRFASCLLMPRKLLKRAWHEWRDEIHPIFLPDLRTANSGYNRNEMTQSDSRK